MWRSVMTSQEFAEWRAVDEILDPGEPTRGDLQTAILAGILANMTREQGDAVGFDKFLVSELLVKARDEALKDDPETPNDLPPPDDPGKLAADFRMWTRAVKASQGK